MCARAYLACRHCASVKVPSSFPTSARSSSEPSPASNAAAGSAAGRAVPSLGVAAVGLVGVGPAAAVGCTSAGGWCCAETRTASAGVALLCHGIDSSVVPIKRTDKWKLRSTGAAAANRLMMCGHRRRRHCVRDGSGERPGPQGPTMRPHEAGRSLGDEQCVECGSCGQCEWVECGGTANAVGPRGLIRSTTTVTSRNAFNGNGNSVCCCGLALMRCAPTSHSRGSAAQAEARR